MPMSRLQAIKKLSWMVAADTFPELDSNALGELIDSHIRFTTWQPSYQYKVADQIVAQTPNGRVYTCIIAGTSGTVQPPFPQIWYSQGQNYQDGNQLSPDFPLTWMDAGFVQTEIYDVRAAAREGWMRKASIAANLANTNDGKMSIDLHTIQENCIQMASKYRSFGIL